MSDWLNPLNRIAIQKAVRGKKQFVDLNTGNGNSRQFEITYLKSEIHIKPVLTSKDSSLVPRGYFPISKIKDPAWLTS